MPEYSAGHIRPGDRRNVYDTPLIEKETGQTSVNQREAKSLKLSLSQYHRESCHRCWPGSSVDWSIILCTERLWGSIPGQGKNVGFRFDPWLGHV